MGNDLNLTYVSLGLIYPSLPRFSGAQLAVLYASLRKRHDFEEYTEHPNEGATLQTEGVRELEVTRDNITMEEEASRGFDNVRRAFIDYLSVVRDNFPIPVLAAPRVEFRANWPLGGDRDAARELQDRALKISKEQIDTLKLENLHSVGISIVADIREGNHLYMDVGPSANDEGSIYLRIRNIRHDTLEKNDEVEQVLNGAYEYLEQRIAPFLEKILL